MATIKTTNQSSRGAVKKAFLAIICAMIVLCGGSCVLLPTGGYIAEQFSENPNRVRESNEWPCGNITRMTTVLLEDVMNEPDDYVLPPALDRSLKVVCIVFAYPVSLVFDVLSFPYQWWRYYHLPPTLEEKMRPSPLD